MKEHKLELKKIVSVDPETAFDTWNDQEQIKKWMVSGEGFSVPESEVDLRVDGEFKIVMKAPTGDLYTAVGKYLEVNRPEKVVYTWRWESKDKPDMFAGETKVTVEFQKTIDGTEVKLTHEGFTDDNQVKAHTEGWSSIMNYFVNYLK